MAIVHVQDLNGKAGTAVATANIPPCLGEQNLLYWKALSKIQYINNGSKSTKCSQARE